MADIQRWLDKLYDPEGEYTHMVVRCDTFEYRGSPYDKCCCPVYFIAKSFEDAYKQANDAGDRVMEVYSRSHTREEQAATRARVFNYD